MKSFLKKISQPVLFHLFKWYFSQPRKYSYKKLSVRVLPGVFPPNYTFSTGILLKFLEPMAMEGKNFLELGCGCGIISVFAAKKGADVTASDIFPKAAINAEQNAILNGETIQAIESDLFKNINPQKFDLIVINPPYYPRKPKDITEYAWFCGEEFEYFKRLFEQIGNFIHAESEVFMILSEDCQLAEIQKISTENGFEMTEVFRKQKIWEWSMIYSINSK